MKRVYMRWITTGYIQVPDDLYLPDEGEIFDEGDIGFTVPDELNPNHASITSIFDIEITNIKVLNG